MRHVMVKIELDSRLQGGQREVDTMLARLEAGRVCVVCTKYVFIFLCIYFSSMFFFVQDQVQLLCPRAPVLCVSVLNLQALHSRPQPWLPRNSPVTASLSHSPFTIIPQVLDIHKAMHTVQAEK